MGKQPTTGQKKSKDAISKAASQTKGTAKVPQCLFRNGTRVKLKKKLIMPSSSIKLPMINTLQVSPNLESTSPLQFSSKNTKLSAQSQEPCLKSVSRMDLLSPLRITADKLSTPQQYKPLRRQSSLKLRILQLRRIKPQRRNDVARFNVIDNHISKNCYKI